MGHYPVCPWCKEYIYDINDFTWDHIVPKAAGGADSVENLQPMHRHCNNAAKNDCVYQMDYHYDIQTELEHTILDVRVAVCKKQKQESKKKKGKYNNNKQRVKTRSRQR
jgi:5-methylcytosine-specific restriction endonuclease McrA